MTNDVLTANEESLKTLEALTKRLSDTEAYAVNADGWTVSGILAHLAFWDRHALILLRNWKETGVQAPAVGYNAINDALAPILNVLPMAAAIHLAIEAARAIHAKIASLLPAFRDEVLQSPRAHLVNRAQHRLNHLGEIEPLLSR